MRHEHIDRSALLAAGVKNSLVEGLKAGVIVGAIAAVVIAIATAFA